MSSFMSLSASVVLILLTTTDLAGESQSHRLETGGGFAGDRPAEEQVLFLFPEGRLPADLDYRFLLESRGSIKKDPGRERRFHQTSHVSAAFAHDLVALTMGRRFLPGPRTNFLLDPDAYSAFPQIPAGRDRASIFLQPLPRHFAVPGPFWLSGESQPGAFLAWDRRLLLAAHPSGHAVLTVHGVPLAGVSAYADLIRSPRTWTGYGRLGTFVPEETQVSSRSTERDVDLLIEAERKETWDYLSLSSGEVYAEREGRSGLGQVFVNVMRRFEAGAAGFDRGPDGFRTMELAWTPRLPFADIHWLLRGRYYERRHYNAAVRNVADGSLVDSENAPPGSGSDFADHALATGLEWRDENFGVRTVFESRRSGVHAGELDLFFRSREPSLEFSVGAVYGTPAEHTFFFLRSSGDRESGLRFYGDPDAAGGLVLRLKHRHVYILVESRIVNRRPQSFGVLQFRWELY